MPQLPPYRLIRSRRKTISIQLTPDNQVVVRCPYGLPIAQIEAVLAEKAAWLEKHRNRLAAIPKEPPFSQAELQQMAQRTEALLKERLPLWAATLGVTYCRVTVRCQRTRWGSCSSRGNLNFNCLLALVPEEVLDYVVVHELCHRKQMNHAPAFWAEVGAALPNYPQCKAWLKENAQRLLARIPD